MDAYSKRNPTKTAENLIVDDLAHWNLSDLRDVLMELKMKATGTKKELIERLRPFQKESGLLKRRLQQVHTSFVFRIRLERPKFPNCQTHGKQIPLSMHK